ncbi:SRPBCC family protein [Flexivirga sp.]|uniref:SRPBCC family protein n=1 Tax=Flexivirga sp. TaxID=1962927 RepID=UPI003F813108
MSQEPARAHRESIVVATTPEALYDVVSDITRTGEWSPICTGCWWDDESEAGQVGALFTGHNEQPGRTWETRSRVVAADRPREFAWVVGEDYVRWGYTLEPDDAGTRLTESWQFLPNGIAMFHDKYGDEATAHIEERTDQAHRGIPQTLAAIKRIAESS